MQFLTDHNLLGLLIGACTFLIIGIFHPIVIKAEYHLGVRCWWMFLVAGLLLLGVCVWLDNVLWQSLVGVTAFSCFWSILEVFEQRKRVERGWFPRKPSSR